MPAIYGAEVVDTLDQLERQGFGKRIEVSEGLFGLSKGTDPEVVLTSCYHANEIYATYQSLLRLARTTQEPCIIIPVVDATRFESFKRDSEKSAECQEGLEAGFLYDSIKGFYERPQVMRWQFDDENACPEVKGISKVIEKCSLVIDLHNSCVDGYMLLYNPSGRSIEREFISRATRRLEADGKMYDGFPGYNHKKVSKGIFENYIPKTVLSFAASRGIMNLVIEVPVFEQNQAADFERLEILTSDYLDHLLKEYYKLRREENGDQ